VTRSAIAKICQDCQKIAGIESQVRQSLAIPGILGKIDGDHRKQRLPLRDENHLVFVYSSINFCPTPPPVGAFVENKSQTQFRPNGDRPVEAPFWPYFDYQSRSIFWGLAISKFTN
jgi:hypothetical protein